MTILLNPHLTHLRAVGKSAATVEARHYVLSAADRALPYGIDEASTDDWLEFLAVQRWAAWTRATYFGHYSGFYEWATDGYDSPLDWNPLANVPRPPGGHNLPDPVDTHELETAIRRSDEWWQFAIALAAHAGLRAGELADLQREDVTAERIRVRHGKGDKPREIPTHPEIWERVAGRPAGPLLVSPVRHVPVSRHRLTVMARRHFDDIGMPDVHMHRFRHWFATALIRRGVDISIVSKLMGHASLSTTQMYVLISGRQRRDAIQLLPGFNDRPLPEPPE